MVRERSRKAWPVKGLRVRIPCFPSMLARLIKIPANRVNLYELMGLKVGAILEVTRIANNIAYVRVRDNINLAFPITDVEIIYDL